LWDAKQLLARGTGPTRNDRDALDDLADGTRRPSEVDPAELPEALQGIPLEPLLDAIFDYVDARRVYARAYASTPPAVTAEEAIAAAIIAPPRRRPSER